MGKIMKTDSISLSLPEEKVVRGYIIKKMPLGAFLQAAQLLQNLPEKLMDAVYPGEGLEGLRGHLKTLDKAGLMSLIARAAVALPETVIAVFSKLSGIPKDKLENDPAIGIDGLMELMTAWIEVNGIENFMQAAKALTGRVKVLAGR